MDALLAKIYGVMMSPSGVVNNPIGRVHTSTSEKPFISFCSPGVAIEDLDFGLLQTKDEVTRCAAFSRLINSIPAISPTWQPKNDKVWDIYEQAITQVKLPRSDLSSEEHEILKRAENFLYEIVETTDPFTLEVKKETRLTSAYQAYEKLFTAYSSAVIKYNSTKQNAISDPTPTNVADWTNNGSLYEQQVRNAYSMWGSAGYRDYVTRANGIISNFMARSPYAMYERLRNRFALAEKKDFLGFSFYPTFGYPSKVMRPEFKDAWTTFSLSQQEIHEFASAESTSWGGGVSGGWGLWSWGGGTSYSEQKTFASADTSTLGLSVELIQVPIQRPWLTSWIFSSRGWKGVGPLAQDGSISSGQYPLSDSMLMPLMPVSVILARNLKITTKMTSDENETFASQRQSSVSVGWGPFSLRGNYSHSESSQRHDYESNSEGLVCPGTQIIGFVCDVLPKSPNPDESLDFSREVGPLGFAEDKEEAEFNLALEAARWLR